MKDWQSLNQERRFTPGNVSPFSTLLCILPCTSPFDGTEFLQNAECQMITKWKSLFTSDIFCKKICQEIALDLPLPALQISSCSFQHICVNSDSHNQFKGSDFIFPFSSFCL
ncbi:hypothetical protein SAY87_007017 [Trapa incisa]|uniref:Uncharacterized protein n=1 Tax=Trapa incisa TaxID=236973 RepID=A0AAN7Q4X4_9MYRT|nr:hypothetical protein SAY87_007017 [Trapa incisa]